MSLLRDIERHLTATGMAPTRFGKEVLRDPGFIESLRNGRELRPATLEKVRAYLDRPVEAGVGAGGKSSPPPAPKPVEVGPSGLQLFRELANAAVARHLPIFDFVRPLTFGCNSPKQFLTQLKAAQRPRQATVDRVRALIAGAPLPAPEVRRHSPRRDVVPDPASTLIVGNARFPASWRAEPVRSPLAEKIRTIGREVEAEERRATLTAGTPTFQQAIQQATAEWPELWARCRSLAAEIGKVPGEALRLAISAGLECLEEGGA